MIASRFARNVCSNGGALSSIGVSWRLVRSEFTGNRAIGHGANPARAGTPGGGSGGAIYNDGNHFALKLTDSRLHGNHAREGGGAILFVSNGHARDRRQPPRGQPQQGLRDPRPAGIFFLGAGKPAITNSIVR